MGRAGDKSHIMKKLMYFLAVALAVVVGIFFLSWLFGGEAGNTPLTSDEVCFLNRINGVRTQHGVAPVQANDQLTATARGWSAKMASDNAISHNPAYFGL